MEKLLNFLNSKTRAEQQEFVDRCNAYTKMDTTINSLRKACSVGQLLNPVLCVAIERETGGEVTRQQLRPDDWGRCWPELAETKRLASSTAAPLC